MYSIRRLLSEEQIEELRTFPAPWVDSHIEDASCQASYLHKFNFPQETKNRYSQFKGTRKGRSGKNKVVLFEWFEEINEVIEKEFGGKIVDCNYLRYDVGDFLVPHKDTYDGSVVDMDGRYLDRTYTIVTMVDKSEDLEGGILVLRDSENGYSYHDLDIGETISFPAGMIHECTLVTQGYREVYVTWV
jgi:predicted 2-oxoglutarate/Fe(II)-dependent dioxygenase YbiX